MTAIPFSDNWDRATASESPPWTGWRSHALLVGFAAAAVLTVAIWPGTPPPPLPPAGPEVTSFGVLGPAPAVFDEAMEYIEAFEQADSPHVPQGLSREEEERHLGTLIRARSGPLEQAQGALSRVIEADDDPQVQARAHYELASLHLEMGVALATMPHPSHLNDGQAEAYQQGLVRKAGRQWELSLESATRAEVLANAQGVVAVARASRELAGQVAALVDEYVMRDPDLEAANDKRRNALREQLTEQRRDLDRCRSRLDVEQLEEAELIYEQVSIVVTTWTVTEGALPLSGAEELLGAYGPALAKACAE